MTDDKPLTDEELKAIEARAEAASPAPWRLLNPQRGSKSLQFKGPDGLTLDYDDVDPNRQLNDGRFLAHARTDVPALVREVRRLRTERDAAVRGDATYAAAVSLDTEREELANERDALAAEVIALREHVKELNPAFDRTAALLTAPSSAAAVLAAFGRKVSTMARAAPMGWTHDEVVDAVLRGDAP